ncbi:MAG: hypothetical protein AAGA92_14025 [Planctomycetota bacterium]
MKSHYSPKLAALLRSAARYGSVAAALIFGLVLVTDRDTVHHLERFASGLDPYPELPVFLGLVFGAVLGGFVAWNRRLAASGVALTAASLAAAFAWCASTLDYSLSPFMITLVGPAGMLLLARQLEQIPVETPEAATGEGTEERTAEEPELVPAASVA